MTLSKGTDIVAMAILPAGIVAEGPNDEDYLSIEGSHDMDYSEGKAAETPAESSSNEEQSAGPYLLLVTQQGLGKRTCISEFRLRARTGSGIQALRLNLGDRLAAVQVVGIAPSGSREAALDSGSEDESSATKTSSSGRKPEAGADVVLSTQQGQLVRVPVADVNIHSRFAKGHRLVKVRQGDEVVAATVLSK